MTTSALPIASSRLGATRRPSRDKDSVFDEVRFHTVVSSPRIERRCKSGSHAPRPDDCDLLTHGTLPNESDSTNSLVDFNLKLNA